MSAPWMYCDGMRGHVMCLKHGFPLWQHYSWPSTSVLNRHRRDMTSYVKGKVNRKTIMRASIHNTLYYWLMCMHWLKCVRLDRKDRLKNMHATTLEVAMLADVSGTYSAISSFTKVWLGPSYISLRHSLWMYLTLIGQQNVNGAALESWPFVVDNELRC